MKNLIITPTFNERKNIKSLIDQIFLHSSESDILVVDDNSPDGTSQKVQELQKNIKIYILKFVHLNQD